jgi:aminocarboxymuconate-semialdehyde decarboxylase
MTTRRTFLTGVAGTAAGLLVGDRAATALARQVGAPAGKRREVSIAGRRIKTIDVHAHCFVPEVADLVKNTPLADAARGNLNNAPLVLGNPQRLRDMDAQGIDIQVINTNAWGYNADRALARDLIALQNDKIAQWCAAHADRFVGMATVALQFPELAAEQLEAAVKKLGMRGAAIAGSCEGQELSDRKFDPFWAKAEELQALVFIHPNQAPITTGARQRLRGSGALANVIGNPLDTSLALAHLIFEGAFDRFPNLRICAAHGGGFLPSYAARMDHGCSVFPAQCKGPKLKKQPSEYLKQIYIDSIVFTPEALRHLVNECGASQIMIGTDSPIPWVKNPVDHVLNTPGLSDDERIAILGGTAAKLLKI